MGLVAAFGASDRTARFLAGPSGATVAVIVDSDSRKQGDHLAGRPILDPSVLSGLDVEEVVILSVRTDEVRRQLNDVLGFAGRVRVPTAAEFAGRFEDELVREALALYITSLSDVISRRTGFLLTAIFGTALGISRDGDFIMWDSDVDLAVPSPAAGAVLDHFASESRSGTARVVSAGPKAISLLLTLESRDGLFEVPASIALLDLDGPMTSLSAYGRELLHPSSGFLQPEPQLLRGRRFHVPAPAARYLEDVYGPGWRVPRTDWTIEDYRATVRDRWNARS